MASATFAEMRARFDAYAREISAPRQDLSSVFVDRMVRWSAILQDTESFLADTAKFSEPYADDMANLIAWVTLLRQAVARLLAAAGPVLKDQSHADALNLTSEQAEFIADLLNNPPEPNDALRFAARQYRATVGI